MKVKIIYPNWAVNPGNVGDTICTTSVVKAVLNKYPDAEITYVANEFACDMLMNHPRVKTEQPDDRLLQVTHVEWSQALRKGHIYDKNGLTIVLYPEWQYDLFSHLRLNKNLDKILNNPEANIITYNFCRMAGFEDFKDQRPEVVLNANDLGKANFLFPKDNWIAVNVSPKRQSQMIDGKSWFRYDLKLATKLIELLWRAGYKVLEVGYNKSLGIGDVSLGHRSLRECCSVMKKCKLFIGNDGGMHNIANAVNIPVLLFQSYPYNPPELFVMGNGIVLDNGCSVNKSCDHWARIKCVKDAKESCDKSCERLSPELIAEKAIKTLRR